MKKKTDDVPLFSQRKCLVLTVPQGGKSTNSSAITLPISFQKVLGGWTTQIEQNNNFTGLGSISNTQITLKSVSREGWSMDRPAYWLAIGT